MKDATRRRNTKIVTVWNMGVNTLAELGQAFHLPRNSIGRILTESRQAGMSVLNIDFAERSARMSRSQQRRRAARAETSSVPAPPPQAGDGDRPPTLAPNPTF